MTFQKKRIRHNLRRVKRLSSKPEQQPLTENQLSEHPAIQKHNRNHQHVKLLTIAASIMILLFLVMSVIGLVRSLDFSSIILSFGQELNTDQQGNTNFLLVGTGNENHDGANLTDTIIVANLNQETKNVKMLSLPRDLYIEDKETGGQRINKIYDSYFNLYGHRVAMENLKQTVENITALEIQYYVKVDFDGFVEIIDSIGGIDIYVENAIYDPYYPLDGTIRYTTFTIQEGQQHLDGETALKYARSRKTTSDFDRAKRQQQILSAVKEKALSLNLLTDAGKIKELYTSLSDSFETDLQITEILELAKLGQDSNRDQISSQVLTDDFTSCGGFLYTPTRDYFGGAAVLLPAGTDYEVLHDFAENYFNTNFITEAAPIQVLNGTRISGLAYKYLNILNRYCLNTVYYGNASNRDLDQTTIYYRTDEEGNAPQALELVTELIDAPTVTPIPFEYLDTETRMDSEIVIEFGADYNYIAKPDPFDSLMYLATETPDDEEEEDSTSTEATTTTETEPVTTTEETITDTTTDVNEPT